MTSPFAQHGAFSWFELMTSDLDGAKPFYKTLFGWELTDRPMPNMPDATYTVAKLGEQEAGGLMTLPSQMTGAPPCWMVYITVQDVDVSAQQAQELGGKVLMPPTDIPDVGRFAVIQDPQGAAFNIMTYLPMAS